MFAEEEEAGSLFKGEMAVSVDVFAPFVRSPPAPLLPYEVVDLSKMNGLHQKLFHLK